METRRAVRRPRLRVGLMLIGLVIAVAVVPSCGGGTEGEGAEPSGTEAAEPGEPPQRDEVRILMQNTAFQPRRMTVAPGTTVTWTNEDSFEHTVTSGARGEPTEMFDETVQPEESFSYTFEEAGTYDYFCSIHRGMDGVIIVED